MRNGTEKKRTYDKISKIKFRYDAHFDNFDEELERLYTEEGWSYRDIEKWINTNIIRFELQENGFDPMEGESEYLLSLIQNRNGEFSEGVVNDARERLRNYGVNVEQMEKFLVSYQTVGKYLKNQLGLDTSQDTEPDLEKSRNTINALTSRTQAAATRTLDRLRDADLISIGEFNVSVNVTVRCTDCRTTYTIFELIRKQTCNCESPKEVGGDAENEAAAN